uniref:Uncharacterized protein MANES_13G060700 n=1 Tax=Rhizophora mucronata TaxID=61149 RepID=A0A2P2MLU2_RHIMU
MKYRGLVRSEEENVVQDSNPESQKQNRGCPVPSLFPIGFAFQDFVFLGIIQDAMTRHLKITLLRKRETSGFK